MTWPQLVTLIVSNVTVLAAFVGVPIYFLNQRITDLGTGLNARLARIEERLDRIEERLDSFDVRIARLEERVH